MEKCIRFIKKHREILALSGLLIVCYFLYFFSIGNYPLIFPQEESYFSISRSMHDLSDYISLHLNGNYFFGKPPLFFFFESTAFTSFHIINEITARIPVALSATYGVFLTYFLGKRICSKKYGMICALILATSIEYIFLARCVVINMLFAICTASSVFSGIYTLFCTETYKKYFWWLAYIMAGFSVLANGLSGAVLSALVIFLAYVTARKWEEVFKPLFIVPGLVFFCFVALPWHIIMYNLHGTAFVNAYLMKQFWFVFTDFTSSPNKYPFYYFLPIFLFGLMPWTFSFFAQIIVFVQKSLKNVVEFFTKFNNLQRLEQFIVLNVIFFVVAFLIFALSNVDVTMHVLILLFPISMILGKFWLDFICKDENERVINISTLLLNFLFILIAIGLLLLFVFIDKTYGSKFIVSQILGIILIMFAVIINSFALFKDKKLLHFLSISGVMILFSMFFVKFIIPCILDFM